MDELIHSSDRRNPNYLLARFIHDIPEVESFFSQGMSREISLRNPLAGRKAKVIVQGMLKAFHMYIPELVFSLPATAESVMKAHSNSLFPLLIPEEFKTFLFQTQLCEVFQKLFQDTDSDMYKVFCYYFWKEMPKQTRGKTLPNDLPKVTFDPSITTFQGVEFNPEDFDVILTGSITHAGHGSTDQDKFRGLSPAEKKDILSQDRMIVRLRDVFSESPVLTEFISAYLSAISQVFMQLNSIKVTLISMNYYPTYIPAKVKGLMAQNGSPELRELLFKNQDYQISSLFWYITRDISKRFIIQTVFESEEDPNQVGRYESFNPKVYSPEHLSYGVDFEKILMLFNISKSNTKIAATLIDGGKESIEDGGIESVEYDIEEDSEFVEPEDFDPSSEM